MSEIRTQDNKNYIWFQDKRIRPLCQHTYLIILIIKDNYICVFTKIFTIEGCNISNIICGYTPKNKVKNINGNKT